MLKLINDAGFDSPEYKAFHKIYNDPKNNSWMVFPYRDEVTFYGIYENYKKTCEIFAAQNPKGEYVGICRLTTSDTGPYQGIATINSLAIDSEFHGQGYGRQILEELIAYIKIQYPHVFRIELAYEGDNPIAFTRRFYEKNGFLDEGHCHDWFDSRALEFKKGLFPWFTAEYFACYFLKENLQENKFKAKSLSSKSTFNSLNEITEFKFAQAHVNEAALLDDLYEYSLTSWAHEKEERIELIAKSLEKNKIFKIFEPGTNQILAACELDLSPTGIGHTLMLQNLVCLNNNIAAASFLFKNLIAFIQNEHPEIKRIELNIVADNKAFTCALEQNGFKPRAQFPARFKDVEGCYRDEILYEYSLFGLEDAIACCAARKNSELNLVNNKNKKFFLPLPLGFLNQLENELNQIKESSLSFEKQNFIYQLVRIICTQDCYTAENRIKQCLELENDHKEKLIDSAIHQIYFLITNFLQPKLEYKQGFWTEAVAPSTSQNIEKQQQNYLAM